ncbi:MAG TPA: hypothetical protein VHQ47_20535 [Phycisphaerae bacterium]|nr:hypothetical protein [Phycisphaerae bacterium]
MPFQLPLWSSFNPQELVTLFQTGRHEELSDCLLAMLDRCFTRWQETQLPRDQQPLDTFVSLLLQILTQPTFLIPDTRTLAFIRHNRTIANLVALTPLQTTDAALTQLRDQPHNFAKVLTLYSPRNTVRFDPKPFFDLSPPLANRWFACYAQSLNATNAEPEPHRRLRDHFAFTHPAIAPEFHIPDLYYAVSYLGGDLDPIHKPIINISMQRIAARIPINNRPNPRKALILSAAWNPEHSVYRICAAHVRELKKSFHLTFLYLGRRELFSAQDTSLFDHTALVDNGTGQLDLSLLLNNDFALAYFPDVGMSQESTLLANMRIAPLQIAGLGHSASTRGALIDYFISGADAERPDHPESDYSERLILLPGFGCIHEKPRYSHTNPAPPADRILINCSWSAQKITAPFLHTLQKLFAPITRPITLNLFLGPSARHAFDQLLLTRHLQRSLPALHINAFGPTPYPDYMRLSESAHLALDSYPFGGCNTVSDSLFLRIPILTWQGSRWCARIGPAMLRSINLPELIAETEDHYITTARRLITDDQFRTALRSRLATANLDDTLYSTSDASAFLTAINKLLTTHPNPSTRTPIYISPPTPN